MLWWAIECGNSGICGGDGGPDGGGAHIRAGDVTSLLHLASTLLALQEHVCSSTRKGNSDLRLIGSLGSCTHSGAAGLT